MSRRALFARRRRWTRRWCASSPSMKSAKWRTRSSTICCGGLSRRGAKRCATRFRTWISRRSGSMPALGPKTCCPPITCALLARDELDLVAVGVLDERNHAGAALDRPRLARHLAALRPDRIAGLANIVDLDRHVPIGASQVVALDAIVVRQLEHGAALLGVVAHEGELVPLLGTVGGAQQLHAEHFGIEADRAVQVADAQHGVQDSHGFILG